MIALARPVRAESVEVSCPLMSLLERSELQARARLLLSSAGVGSASVTVACDENSAWVAFGGGVPMSFSTEGSLVEGALDAIEAQLGSSRLPPGRAAAPPSAPSAPPSPPPGSERSPIMPPVDEPVDADTPQAARRSTRRVVGTPIDGGVSVAIATEFWSGALGVGPRLDIGVGLGKRWAVVVGQGARFATAGTGSAGLVFDLQSGIGYGAPYAMRTGLGVLALVGAERMASVGQGGLWVWSFTGSLGLRASVASGPVDVWLGVDVMARSDTIDSADERIPNVTGLLTLGCLIPAFSTAGLFHATAPEPGDSRHE